MSTRWDPLRDIVTLREAMNNLLEENFVRPRTGAGSLPVDILERVDAYVVLASLPGVKLDEVDITMIGNSIRISGALKEQAHRSAGPRTHKDSQARERAGRSRTLASSQTRTAWILLIPTLHLR